MGKFGLLRDFAAPADEADPDSGDQAEHSADAPEHEENGTIESLARAWVGIPTETHGASLNGRRMKRQDERGAGEEEA